MATTPHTPAKPPTPPPATPHEPDPAATAELFEWTPEASPDPRSEKAPQGAYADAMGIADEQRSRSAATEAMGMAEYMKKMDERPPEEPKKQVPGVAPPTKRE
jgi:hypothetical protein